MKFGGTSVESAQAMERAAGIVRERLDRHPVVVVSAMGKTTNKLLAIAGNALRADVRFALDGVEELRKFHLSQSEGLGIDTEVSAHFDELAAFVKGIAILGELTPRATDAISALGERVSSLIAAARFRACGIETAHVDSRKVMITDSRHTQAAPLLPQIGSRIQKYLLPAAKDRVAVMGGFIGSTEDGVTTTLGRGGSDYTASIIGAALGAEEIQIWTDVDGMLTADPNIIAGAHRVRICSFAEAAELAYFGAKVLHPATVLPAIQKNIPVRILNSRRPEVEGTLIVSNPPESGSPIRSIACKRNITLVNIVSSRMLMAHGFLRRIFEVFDRYETPVDMLATSEVSVSITVDNTRALPEIRAEIESFAEVSIEENQAIVCLVGENIRRCPDTAARVFRSLHGIEPRMVSQGASQLNISMVVAASDLGRAVESLHREFFRSPDPAAFA
ncbi:MAG TPA: lysine-sensitive aspartokinase 3 [Bryobacteraceae bacterium]|nr:lysine-sensitive aspartokinase 3 [Bryobacteraceae bacterium]